MSNAPALSILHVVAPGDVGGVESVVRLMAIGHRQLGHEVHVAAVAPGEGARDGFLSTLREGGVQVTILDVQGRAYLRERALVSALCQQLRPDAVHTHGYRPDIVASGAARARRIPTVTTVHGFTGGDVKNRLYERLQHRIFRRFGAVVAVSRPLAKQLAERGVPQERLHLLPNAYAVTTALCDREAARASLGVALEGVRIGWVGRLSAEKGVDVLVDALAHLRQSEPVPVSVLGNGAEWDTVRLRASERGVAGQITWHGAVPHASRLLPAFDVLVLSSRTEGTPMVVLEAMAAGVPIVATRVGGIPDILSPREALLVQPENPAALAAAIGAVFAEPARAMARAHAARQRLATEFALAPWLARYEAIYRQLQHPFATIRS